MNQFDGHLYVITRHTHFYTFRKVTYTSYVSCSEVELRSVVVEERSMTSTFIFGQNVNLSGKFLVAFNAAGFCKNLSSFDFSSLNTTKQSTDVITSLRFIQHLTEHFDTGNNRFLGLFFDTNDFNFFIQVKGTTLYSTGSNSTTACDGEYVFYRHQERLVCVTLRIRNILINSSHQLKDLVAPFALRIFQSFQSGTLDNRSVISGEFILVQQVSDFHFNQLKQFRIVYHVTFVHEYYDIRNAYLTGQQDVFFGLSHNTIGSCNNQDSTIHLSCTSDHVLYIVSMAGAVNVCVMSVLCFILNVSCGNGDTTFSFFRSLVDHIESYSFTGSKSCIQSLGNSCCQSSFTMVNVADGTNVTMRLVSFKFSFSHF